MAMENTTIEQLLHEEEGVSLDFKSRQYPFKGASDHQKSEIVKDILAFANAWRRTTAFILVGVKEKKGGRSEVVGVKSHLDDSDVQQLVLSKVNKPIEFSYKATRFEGEDIGVFKIKNQSSERPFYVTKDFGKLNEGQVPIRRSSSTENAYPDEVKKMGIREVGGKKEGKVSVEWSKEKDLSLTSRRVNLNSEVIKIKDLNDIEDIPEYKSNTYPLTGIEPVNENYYREMIAYKRQKRLTENVFIKADNLGSSVLKNTKVRLSSINDSIIFLEKEPHEPSKKKMLAMPYTSEPAVIKDEIELNLGDIQPGDRRWSRKFRVGGYKGGDHQVNCEFFADDINTSATLTVRVNATFIEATIENMIDVPSQS